MAVRDFRGAQTDPAMTAPDRLVAFGKRAVCAYGVDPSAFTASLLAPYTGVRLDDEEEPDPPEEPTCAPTEMTWYMAGTSTPPVNAPVVTCVTAEGEVASNQVIQIDVTDEDEDLVNVRITVTFPGNSPEVVYDGLVPATAFSDQYDDASVADGDVGIQFYILRDGGWPADFVVTTVARDAQGHETTHECSYTVSEPAYDDCINPEVTFHGVVAASTVGTPCYEAGETGATDIAPVVEFISPPLGQSVYRYTRVVFRVKCVVALRRVVVRATYANRDGWDFLHDGAQFGPNFRGEANTRVTVSGVEGFPFVYEFEVMRDGGWPGQPIVTVYPVNIVGTEDEGQDDEQE